MRPVVPREAGGKRGRRGNSTEFTAALENALESGGKWTWGLVWQVIVDHLATEME